MQVFSRKLMVSADHLDFNNHVNNLVYMQWALDISREHWLSNVTQEVVENFFWVVRRHHIEYKGQAFEGDGLVVKTFVESIRGPFSERVVQIFKNEELITEVRSNWCFLDRKTQKLKRVPEEIQKLF